jgi:hypothetical protein
MMTDEFSKTTNSLLKGQSENDDVHPGIYDETCHDLAVMADWLRITNAGQRPFEVERSEGKRKSRSFYPVDAGSFSLVRNLRTSLPLLDTWEVRAIALLS